MYDKITVPFPGEIQLQWPITNFSTTLDEKMLLMMNRELSCYSKGSRLIIAAKYSPPHHALPDVPVDPAISYKRTFSWNEWRNLFLSIPETYEYRGGKIYTPIGLMLRRMADPSYGQEEVEFDVASKIRFRRRGNAFQMGCKLDAQEFPLVIDMFANVLKWNRTRAKQNLGKYVNHVTCYKEGRVIDLVTKLYEGYTAIPFNAENE